MSEIEITEDNYILNDAELKIIDDIFNTGYKGVFELKDVAKNIYLKITKLNELGKEQER